MNEMTTRRSLRTSAIAIAFLTMLACASNSNGLARQRPVRVGVTPEPPKPPVTVQWNHEWARGAVFYQVFVRSFQDSNGDGIGDLNGLTSKLDYLNDGNPATTTDLGINALWLMPIFQSPSYHGYDTTDYETIESDYGTNADFQRLLDEAHKRGIRVIVDFVMNHSSNQHPWFVESASSPSSPKRNWYVWSASDRGWTQPWGGNNGTWHERNGAYYYGVFWAGMPDINYGNPEAKAEVFRIAKMWLQRGVDGYRLDATRYLVETGGGPGQADTPETHQVLKEFATVVRETKPDAILVAENWTDTPIIATYFGSTSTIAGGDEMPMNFNFPLASEIISGTNSSTSTAIQQKITEVQSSYPEGVIDAPFLTNHDQVRLATVLGNNQSRMRSVAAILLTLPGAPFLYYGEEVGLQNGPTNGDESKRTPMPWTASGGFTTASPWFGYAPGIANQNVASQQGSSTSLLSHYRNWITARKSSDALLHGAIELLPSGSNTLAFLRKTATETVLVVHNMSDSFVSAGPLKFSAAGFTRIYTDGAGASDPSGGSGSWSVALPPRSSGAWKVR